MTAALYEDEKRSLTLTLSKGRGDSGIAECSQVSHTEPLGCWPKGKAIRTRCASAGQDSRWLNDDVDDDENLR